MEPLTYTASGLEQCGRERAVPSRSPLRISANQPDWAVVSFGTEDDIECAADLEPETPVETVEKGATGPANVEPLRSRNTLEASRAMGGSVSIVTDERNGVGVYLALRVNGKVIYGLRDTGCDTSVVSRRVIPDLQLQQTTQKLYAANGTEIALLGKVELTPSMSGHEVTAAVVFSEEVDDLILGIDWLGRHRCRWSVAQNLIEIYRKVVRLISRPRQNMLRRIYAVESVVFPAGHATNLSVTMALSSLAPPNERRLGRGATIFGNRHMGRKNSDER